MENPAVALLQEAINQGDLASQVKSYLNMIRYSSDSWYGQALAKGTTKATLEPQLAEWDDLLSLTPFGGSIESTARGMLALAQGDPRAEIVKVLTTRERMLFPAASSLNEGGELIVAFNPQVPGCGCTQPAGSHVFGLGGELRLQAVVLTFGRSYRSNVQLSLVFPYPNERSGDSKLGFSTVTITPDGSTRGDAIMLGIYPNQTLQYSLGLADDDQLINQLRVSSGINVALTFPGSDQYLAKHIGDLGSYLEAAAVKLAGQHDH